jgi:glyoxylase-like metal-dependent hydrolase (beta-lactamase superfamily II)
VYAVRDGNVNLFLLKQEEAFIAIDAGNSEGGVQQGLDDLGVDPEKVIAVFLTHTDNDHIGGLRLFGKATVYISRAEEQMINGQTPRFWIFKNKLNYPYEWIEDDQVITLPGFTVRGILTPGHTPGSMCYVINDAYLFTGDSMSLEQGKADLFNEAFNMDSDLQRASMGKVMHLPDVKCVFTGHYGFTDDYQNAFVGW